MDVTKTQSSLNNIVFIVYFPADFRVLVTKPKILVNSKLGHVRAWSILKEQLFDRFSRKLL